MAYVCAALLTIVGVLWLVPYIGVYAGGVVVFHSCHGEDVKFWCVFGEGHKNDAARGVGGIGGGGSDNQLW